MGMSTAHDVASLHTIDINLLVCLDALVSECSVTKAAARAGVTQSAMSHTLRKLRELFGDPLLVRGKAGLLPTPRAEALVVPIRRGLRDLARAVAEPEPFDPEVSERMFRLGAPGLIGLARGPSLAKRLFEDGPGLGLSIVDLPRDLEAALETGALDCAIVPHGEGMDAPMPGHLMRKVLFRDRLRCFARPGHPSMPKKRLSLERYLAQRHLLVSPTGEGPGPVDLALAAQGRRRQISMRVPDFAAAIAIVAQTDLVAAAPSALGDVAGDDLVGYDLPFAAPDHALTLVWHPRYGADLDHRCFREALIQVLGDDQ